MAPSNLDAAITLRSAQTEVQNTIELRATASEIAAPKPDPDAKTKKDFEALFERSFKRKIASVNIEKICWRKNTRFRAPAFPPTQAPRNIHAAITNRFATPASKTPCNCNAQKTKLAGIRVEQG